VERERIKKEGKGISRRTEFKERNKDRSIVKKKE
jgi:hypothetical protein